MNPDALLTCSLLFVMLIAEKLTLCYFCIKYFSVNTTLTQREKLGFRIDMIKFKILRLAADYALITQLFARFCHPAIVLFLLVFALVLGIIFSHVLHPGADPGTSSLRGWRDTVSPMEQDRLNILPKDSAVLNRYVHRSSLSRQ